MNSKLLEQLWSCHLSHSALSLFKRGEKIQKLLRRWFIAYLGDSFFNGFANAIGVSRWATMLDEFQFEWFLLCWKKKRDSRFTVLATCWRHVSLDCQLNQSKGKACWGGATPILSRAHYWRLHLNRVNNVRLSFDQSADKRMRLLNNFTTLSLIL